MDGDVIILTLTLPRFAVVCDFFFFFCFNILGAKILVFDFEKSSILNSRKMYDIVKLNGSG